MSEFNLVLAIQKGRVLDSYLNLIKGTKFDIKEDPKCTSNETAYLLNFINEYFQKPVMKKDIVWSYAGVRSLYEDGH